MKAKFRAWDKQDKRMIVDEQDFIPLLVTNKGVFRLNPHHQEPLWVLAEQDRFELMQYVGLTDKYGKEVYEGDIVRNKFESIGTIDFHASWGAFYLKLSIGKNEYGELAEMSGSIPIWSGWDTMEIIGNRYENPELLEASHDTPK